MEGWKNYNDKGASWVKVVFGDAEMFEVVWTLMKLQEIFNIKQCSISYMLILLRVRE